MNEIYLATKSGEHVGMFGIPDFPYGQPKVLIWGERVFLQEEGEKSFYKEVFGFPIPANQLPKDIED